MSRFGEVVTGSKAGVLRAVGKGWCGDRILGIEASGPALLYVFDVDGCVSGIVSVEGIEERVCPSGDSIACLVYVLNIGCVPLTFGPGCGGGLAVVLIGSTFAFFRLRDAGGAERGGVADDGSKEMGFRRRVHDGWLQVKHCSVVSCILGKRSHTATRYMSTMEP